MLGVLRQGPPRAPSTKPLSSVLLALERRRRRRRRRRRKKMEYQRLVLKNVVQQTTHSSCVPDEPF
jgi:hypothetical protein